MMPQFRATGVRELRGHLGPERFPKELSSPFPPRFFESCLKWQFRDWFKNSGFGVRRLRNRIPCTIIVKDIGIIETKVAFFRIAFLWHCIGW